jgi:hypothetical protein
VVSEISHRHRFVLVEDLSTGKRIEVPYGSKDIESAEFSDDHELLISFKDGSEERIDILKLRQQK